MQYAWAIFVAFYFAKKEVELNISNKQWKEGEKRMEEKIAIFDLIVNKEIIEWEVMRLEALTKLAELIRIVRHNVESNNATKEELVKITGCDEVAIQLVLAGIEELPGVNPIKIAALVWDSLGELEDTK